MVVISSFSSPLDFLSYLLLAVFIFSQFVIEWLFWRGEVSTGYFSLVVDRFCISLRIFRSNSPILSNGWKSTKFSSSNYILMME